MVRNILGSWIFAAFLVVVAVATWRVLDASRRPAPEPPTPPLVALLPPAPPTPPTPPTPPPAEREPAVTCGAGSAAFALQEPEPELALVPLQLSTTPFAATTLDGVDVGRTPFVGSHALRVSEGKHRVDFADKRHTYSFDVDVDGASPANQLVVRLGGALHTFGDVKAQPMLGEDAAQAKFEKAVEAFRARDATRACKQLEELTDRLPPESMWRAKAASLFDSRCGDF